MNEVPVCRDDHQHPVPHAWRPTIEAICAALADLDYQLTVCVPDVGQVSPYLAEHLRGNVEGHGVTLAPLPAAAWETSVCAWQGEHWSALIDLWSVEEGPIDLVLEIHVREIGDRFVFHVQMIYVP